jgi:hypothetical protein
MKVSTLPSKTCSSKPCLSSARNSLTIMMPVNRANPGDCIGFVHHRPIIPAMATCKQYGNIKTSMVANRTPGRNDSAACNSIVTSSYNLSCQHLPYASEHTTDFQTQRHPRQIRAHG